MSNTTPSTSNTHHALQTEKEVARSLVRARRAGSTSRRGWHHQERGRDSSRCHSRRRGVHSAHAFIVQFVSATAVLPGHQVSLRGLRHAEYLDRRRPASLVRAVARFRLLDRQAMQRVSSQTERSAPMIACTGSKAASSRRVCGSAIRIAGGFTP